MREKKRITDKVLLRGYEKQYKNIKLLQGRIFTNYDRSNFYENESGILKNLKNLNLSSSYEYNPLDSVHSIKPLLGSSDAEMNSNAKLVNTQTASMLDSSENVNSYSESTSSIHNKTNKYTNNHNVSGYIECRVDVELQKYADCYSKAMKKTRVESSPSDRTANFFLICGLAFAICTIRIWYENTQAYLPNILMILLNFVAFFYTVIAIKTDVYQRFEMWLTKCKIEQIYKDELISDCKKMTTRWIRLIAILIFSLFGVLANKGHIDMFNDLITIAALTISLISPWISDKCISFMEKCTKNNRSFLLFN